MGIIFPEIPVIRQRPTDVRDLLLNDFNIVAGFGSLWLFESMCKTFSKSIGKYGRKCWSNLILVKFKCCYFYF